MEETKKTNDCCISVGLPWKERSKTINFRIVCFDASFKPKEVKLVRKGNRKLTNKKMRIKKRNE